MVATCSAAAMKTRRVPWPLIFSIGWALLPWIRLLVSHWHQPGNPEPILTLPTTIALLSDPLFVLKTPVELGVDRPVTLFSSGFNFSLVIVPWAFYCLVLRPLAEAWMTIRGSQHSRAGGKFLHIRPLMLFAILWALMPWVTMLLGHLHQVEHLDPFLILLIPLVIVSNPAFLFVRPTEGHELWAVAFSSAFNLFFGWGLWAFLESVVRPLSRGRTQNPKREK